MMVANKYQVEIPDVDYYRKLISCQSSCPVNTDARGYVDAIAEGNYRLGYVRARQPNPFASTCGRVCNAPCEAACRRGHIDSPVTIRALKRFVCERYGVEAADHLPAASLEAAAIGSSLLSDLPPFNSRTAGTYGTLLKASASSGHRKGKVAVVGSGPAGITAAHDLSLLGHAVTVFEAAPVPGGQLLLGIPEYRLPRDIIRSEIEEFLKRGGNLKLNMHLGTDFTLDTLREQGYEAIFLAIGAYLDREAGIEGADLEGVVY
ncbi:MAG: NAD(P)-binding protein, partial [Dehalococcoidia bacterium]|nr:NAD(P)-binding protein [Dehalococcoidia bacterium]